MLYLNTKKNILWIFRGLGARRA